MPRISCEMLPFQQKICEMTPTNFGLDISYNFSDGGLKEAQIENLNMK